MNKRKTMGLMSALLVGAQCLTPLSVFAAANTPVVVPESTNVYEQRFLDLYEDIKDSSNGYFSPQGVPYHSIETLMVEAPDHGHESTSETASYYVWLEAMNGKFTGDFSGLKEAWNVIEKYYIPTDLDQPGQTDYNPNSPATYASEYPLPDYYPSQLQFGLPVGTDPIANELKSTYGTSKIYGMHWLIDGDNFYGYGRRGDGVSAPSYINTFQRGEQESTWETIPQPSWEDFKWGGKSGFLPFFTGDANYSKQWRYTNAPDADARLVQAMYWAKDWAEEQGQNIDTYVAKASKMGDYLRYAMFDKYFMKIGAQGKTPGQGYEAAHYLMSWYYAWGGGLDANWSWRIGSSHNHFGYQSPMAAWVLSTDSDMIPKSPNAKRDWAKSLDRQIEFYQWLQSAEGAIAGGATNSYGGSYEKYPAGTSTFYGMAYDAHPVYEDPGSNQWFGMQGWSMQRMAEYYYESGDSRVKGLLDRWAAWAKSEIQLYDDGTFAVPSTLQWSGQPDTWTGSYTGNKNLHVDVINYGTDLGTVASMANTLTFYAAATKKYSPEQDYQSYVDITKEVLDRMWTLYRDDKGVAAPEVRADYKRFFEQEVYVPSNYTGKMANGDEIVPGVTFIELRSKYKNDPDFARLEQAYKNGEDFEITYHRFWAQAEIAIANGTMAMLFPGDEVVMNVAVTTPQNGDVIEVAKDSTGIAVKADASIDKGSISKVEFYADGVKFAEDTDVNYEANYVPTKDNLTAAGTKQVTFKVVAYSDKNVAKESAPITVTLKFPGIELPVVNIVKPVTGDVIDYKTTQTPITVTAEASVKDSTIAKIEFFADGTKIGETTGNGSVSFVPTKDGMDAEGIKEITLTAVATSAEGAKATSEAVKIKVQFKVANKPVVVVTAPAANTVIDATNEKQTVAVSAEATVKDGTIKELIIYADGKEIGKANGATCTATYTTPDGYGPKPDGIVNVVFTAKATTTEDMSATSDAVKVQVKLPVEQVVEPSVNVNVAHNNKGGATTNTLGGQYVVTSDGPVDLSKLAIRHYYTLEGNAAQTAYKDNAGMNLNAAPWYVNLTPDVSVNVVQVSGDQYYMEITFTSNQVLNAGGKIDMGIRLSKNDWSNYDQTNDYSYTSGTVVLYNGEVVSGTMPY